MTERPLPRVPDSGDDGANDVSVPPTSGARDSRDGDSDTKPIRYRRADDSEKSSSQQSCGNESCGCGNAANSEQVAADGSGGAVNVSPDGSLGDVNFTTPTEGTSQDVEGGSPAERVGVPDDADLDTPTYSIRSEMNGIETPDDKTWFMELDAAVIDDGRCTQ